MTRLASGLPVPLRHMATLDGEVIDLADGRAITHLQFRRFAGCPVCNLHLQSFIRRQSQVNAHVREVIVFHSPAELVAAYAKDVPFALVADPGKTSYRAYGVESDARALLNPKAWLAILRSVMASLVQVLRGRIPMPPLHPEGGRYGLPADFLISPSGHILAAHYGVHAADQWSVDAIVEMARTARCATEMGGRLRRLLVQVVAKGKAPRRGYRKGRAENDRPARIFSNCISPDTVRYARPAFQGF